MSAVQWLAAGCWPALLAAPLLVWLGHRARRARARREAAALGPRAQAIAGRPPAERWLLGLDALAALGVALALLQPVWGEPVAGAARPDVVLCLDVSRSMTARDVPPSRLAAAQQAIAALAEHAAGARLGLVAYAGAARLLAPLTTDLASVAELALAAEPTTVARGGTDLGAALGVAQGVLQRGGSRAGAVVVLSDGEDFAGQGGAAAAALRAAGFAVHVFGLGTPSGSKIPRDDAPDAPFLRDAAGDEVVSARRDDALQAVAAQGGGRSAPLAGPAPLLRLHDEVLLAQAAAAAAADPAAQPAHRFAWPLSLAWLAAMLRLCLCHRRR